jgi:hypothetical protein
MNRFSKLLFVPVVAAVLVACGGGGSESPQDSTPAAPAATTLPPTTPLVTKYTQDDVRTVAVLGILTQTITAREVGNVLGFVGGFMQGSADITGGSTVVSDLACDAGGTFSVTTTKATVRTGLAVGDKMALSFVNCDFGTGLKLNGALTALAKSDTAGLTPDDFRVAADLSAVAFEMTFGTVTSKFNGAISGEYIVVGDNSFTASFAVSDALGFTAVVGGAGYELTYFYADGTTFRAVDVISPNSASRQLDGKVSVKTATTSATPLTISTPTALSGTVTGGRFIPTTGSTYVKATNMNLATSVAVSGTTTTVNGDTDRNSSLDLSFNTTWEVLVF